MKKTHDFPGDGMEKHEYQATILYFQVRFYF